MTVRGAAPGTDVLLVRPGELVPCDAVVLDGSAHIDASMLTGEPLPVFASRDTAHERER